MSKYETPAIPVPPVMTDEEAFRNAISPHTNMPTGQADELITIRRDGPSHGAWKVGKVATDTDA